MSLFLIPVSLFPHIPGRPGEGGGRDEWISKLICSCENYYGLLLSLITIYYHLLCGNYVQPNTKGIFIFDP